MPPIAARLAVVVLALVVVGCGGGGDRDSDGTSAAVEAFPDVLEVARSELPENAPLLSVTLRPDEIAFIHVELGRSTEIRYDLSAVFVGNRRISKPVKLASLFPVEAVPADAPARLLAAIRNREGGTVAGFEARLARDKHSALVWKAKATVDGAPQQYEATLDGTLRSQG